MLSCGDFLSEIVCPSLKLSLLFFSVAAFSSGEVIVVAKYFFLYIFILDWTNRQERTRKQQAGLQSYYYDKRELSNLKKIWSASAGSRNSAGLDLYYVSHFQMLFPLLVLKYMKHNTTHASRSESSINARQWTLSDKLRRESRTGKAGWDDTIVFLNHKCFYYWNPNNHSPRNIEVLWN